MPRPSIHDAANRLHHVAFSPVRKVLERARELETLGHTMVHFHIGEPDCDTPQPIVEATVKALRRNLTHYAPNRGLLSLRNAVANDIAAKGGQRYDPAEEILVTVSGAEAINIAVLATVNPGDEVIILTPAFMNYANVIRLAEAIPVEIPLRRENGLQIDPAELQSRITPSTRMLIVNNPSNPSGIVFRPDVLEEVARIAVRHDLLVLSDEMYDEILYDAEPFAYLAAFDGMRERTIVVNGFSKAYAMTGWRLGYVAADKRLMPHMLKVHQYETTCAPTFIQHGVAEAMALPETAESKKAMMDTFARRRNILMDGLRAIPRLTFTEPKGAFYLFLDVSGTGLDGEEFARRLLEEHYVAVVPGVGFGKECTDFVRLSFATSDEDILLGLERIKRFVDGLS